MDTATVHSDSESTLGEFLRGCRDKWLVATKYSGQDAAREATLENHLRTMELDAVHLYMIHWAPKANHDPLYEALYRIMRAGKARLIGVSIYTIAEITRVLRDTEIDAFMVAFNLLDPDPFVAKLSMIRETGVGFLIRSRLKQGILAGKYRHDATVPDSNDQRHKWTAVQIAAALDATEQFRSIKSDAGSMLVGEACYLLCSGETSTVIIGARAVGHADTNFGVEPGTRLKEDTLQRIQSAPRSMTHFDRSGRLVAAVPGLLP